MWIYIPKPDEIPDDESFRCASICSGSGAGDLALRLAVPGARTIAYVENEAHACGSLVRKMETRALAPALVWNDAKSFDGAILRDRIHCLVATYPCQPFSYAGKGLAEKDPRHLWPFIREIIRAAAPPLVFLENVRGHLRRGFESVCRDLQTMDYEIRAGLFSSEAVGAPHGRVRLFAVAYSRRAGITPVTMAFAFVSLLQAHGFEITESGDIVLADPPC